MENLERTNTVLYELYCKPFGTLKIQEPQGWSDDIQTLERDKDSKAIIKKMDIDLGFFGDGAEFITTVFRSLGMSERILLSKYEKSLTRLDEKWSLKYVQELDLGTFNREENTGKVSIKANEGGLYYDIKAREDDEYDLLTNESADGADIGDLKFNYFQPVSRGIFIESLFNTDRNNYSVSTGSPVADGFGAIQHNARTIPLDIVYNSDSEDVYEPRQADEQYQDAEDMEYELFNTSNAFFYQAEVDKSVVVKLKSTFTIADVYRRNSANEKFYLTFVRGEVDEDGVDTQTSREILWQVDNVKDNIGATINIDFNREIFLKKGESLAFHIEVYSESSPDGVFFSGTQKAIVYINAKGELRIQDTTQYDVTINRCIKPFDFFDRLVAKITGKTGLFRSSIFEEGGKYEYFVLDNGFWARGFPDSYMDGDKEVKIQFKTSFKDAVESFSYVEPMAWFIDYEGNQQVLRLEPATYTQQNFIGVEIPSVDDIQSEASPKDFFSTIELGHNGNMDYEEINGLDEPNGKSIFGTHIDRGGNKYSVVSKYRFDAVPYELIRRKSFLNFPKEDTERDEDIWIHDAKLISRPIFLGIYLDVITHKTWEDLGYDQAPEGIYQPDTAWNLDLSPMNRLYYGHGYTVKRGLYHKPGNYIRFLSSNANQNLVTSKDGVVLEESGKVRIGAMENNKVQAEKVTITFKMNQTLEAQFSGFTDVGGKAVPNYFGLIKYSKNGQDFYGRIIKLTGNKETKLELIKAGI